MAAEPVAVAAKTGLEILNDHIQDVLIANPKGLAVKDVVAARNERGAPVIKSDVNKLLYKGFVKNEPVAGGKSKAPVWTMRAPPMLACTGLPSKVGHFAFRIEGAGVFYLLEGCEDAKFLTYISDTLPSWAAAVVRHDGTARGTVFGAIAVELGYLDVKSEP